MATSVGEQLKEERTARGLTLEQAAQATKIRKHYLEALERDDRTTLPSAVQGKGFLRLYAGYLGLDAEIPGGAVGRQTPSGQAGSACRGRDQGTPA